MTRLVNGHVRYGSTYGLATLYGPLALTLALTCLACAATRRIRNGNWRLSAHAFVGCYIVAAMVRLGLHAWRLGGTGLKWAVLAGLWTVLLGFGLLALLSVGRALLGRLPRVQRGHKATRRSQRAWAAASVVLLLGLAGSFEGPVPRWPAEPANAAYSLRSSANDLAAFLLELANPQHLDRGLAAELRRPQVSVSENCAHGLGMGLCHGSTSGYIWHGGDNTDFHSIMAISADVDAGVVVLTNGQRGALVAREVASLALGEPSDWRFR